MNDTDLRALVETDPATAIAEGRRIVAKEADNWSARLLLARALRQCGQSDEAAVFEREALKAATRSPRHREATSALQQGRDFEANTILKRLVDGDPEDVLALLLLGIQASRANETSLADDLLRRAVQLVPNESGTRLALADHYRRTKRFAKALEELEKVPETERDSPQVRAMLAECFGEVGKTDDQLQILRELAELSGDPLAYSIRIALALRTMGRQAEAAAVLREVVRTNPKDGTAWYNLANLKTERFSKADVAAMESSLASPGLPPDQAIRLNFALGVAYESHKEWQKAFDRFSAGNALRERKSTLNPQALPTWVDMNVECFDAEFFASRQGWGDPTPGPIFIVGMQRSGSTLLEQILATHPQIEGTAELREFPSIVRLISERSAAQRVKFSDCVLSLNAEDVSNYGKIYLDETRAYRTSGRPFFIDKLPNNWSNLALIALTLPNAKIIDVRRNPMDCCFSNWKQLYASGLEHTNRFETMAEYYKEYVRLMRHFDDVIPGRVNRVIYDDMIEDTDREIRHVLNYLGLDFDPGMLEFHKTDRAVRTISAAQVRQPINRKGIGITEPYSTLLAPLRKALGATLTDWRS